MLTQTKTRKKKKRNLYKQTNGDCDEKRMFQVNKFPLTMRNGFGTCFDINLFSTSACSVRQNSTGKTVNAYSADLIQL